MFVRPLSRLGLNQLGPLVAATVFVFAACSATGGSASTGSTDTLKVVATTTVFADLVRNIGGDRITVDSIIPAGAGPEDYEPKPDDARKLADADLIVSNGVGLDDFLGDLIDAAGEESAARLVLGDGLETIMVEDEENPHFWLDPSIVADHYVPVIVAKLRELDPAGSDVYQANGTAYADQVRQLDEANKVKIESIPVANRKLVTFHDAFPYFARHYGFEEVGVILENVGQEPTAAELAALVEEVKAANVRAVFSEAQFSPDLSRTLAEEAGISQVVTTLYNDTVGPPPVDTYLKMMEWNVDEIVKALG
jgi:zinc/manganese transport system substrate-binding protein/manganese/iron transport system substrate-binding protein